MSHDTYTLGIDTASVVGVALARTTSDGHTEVLANAVVNDPRAHAEQVMPLVSQVCQQAGIRVDQIGAVAVGVGPGPFTGLRVGIVSALTIAHLAKTTAHGVCSLDVVARDWVEATRTPPTGDFLALIDARRHEVYWARYDASGDRVSGPQVSSPKDLPDLACVGPGTTALGDDPRIVPDGPTIVNAAVLASSWSQLADAGTEPLYLRQPDASEPSSRKSTLTRAVRRS